MQEGMLCIENKIKYFFIFFLIGCHGLYSGLFEWNGKYTLLAKGTCLEHAVALSLLWMPHILFAWTFSWNSCFRVNKIL